ncbi:MAG: carboxypeptidase-like regulatory domain-containing protein [Bacteroidetes bacterium]|nr:carboxypeptidase-like regulatory domain-containing protein [Bacteroidota bacterium]
MPKLLAAILVFVFFVRTQAQFTIKGKVFIAENKEAMPFVNVIIKGTTIGAQTDFDGNFIINTTKIGDSIVATYVGYKRLAKIIKKGVALQEINFAMTNEGGISLEEVTVKAGENPAHRIIRNTVKHKIKNNKTYLQAYEYETYNKLEFDLNRIPKQMRDKKIFKPIKFVFENVDSINSGEKPSLPFFMVENLSHFYYRANPERRKEVVFATRYTGMENSSVSQVLGDMYQNINIYDNNILILGKQLPSPLSENAFFYYKFFLEDSTFEGNKYVYHIRFKPKRTQEMSFTGNIWIADTTWGVKRLEMGLPKDANINFINTANVVQEYSYIDSTWFMTKDRLVIDFSPTKNSIGFYGRKTTSYKKLIFNHPKENKFYEFADKIEVEDSVFKKSDEFWKENRHDSLSNRELKIFKMVDTIRSLPIYKSWVDVFYLVITGYKKFNNFEIGPYSSMISYNRIEGPRFRFGGRTSQTFSKWYQLSGYVAYGLQDEKWKYYLGFQTFLSKSPRRQIVGLNYKSDNEILGQSTNGFSQDNVLASLFRYNPLTNMTRVEHTEAFYDYEWFPGLRTKVSLIGRQFTPLGTNKYLEYNAKGEIDSKPNVVNTEARFYVRFAWKEKYVGQSFKRLSIGSRYPVIQINYAKSLLNAFKGEWRYRKLVANISYRLRITPILGYTDCILEGGKIWGQVPYVLMELHGGNETYLYDPLAFNMMRYYEFASDQFVSLALFHHFDGLFLNKIPLLRRLKWREVANCKMAWGSVNNTNKNVLIFPSTLSSLNNGPYVECSAGIENIFKVFRIDFYYRATYQFANPANNIGLRLGINLAL